jgi:hypothetical protein
MPKATMNEQGKPAAGEDQVRATWKILPVKLKSEAETMQESPYSEFRGRIAGANPGHYFTAPTRVHHVHLRDDLLDIGFEEAIAFVDVEMAPFRLRLFNRFSGDHQNL